MAAHRVGLTSILTVEDQDALDDEAYAVCVGWCVAAGITCIADLDGRVLPQSEYEKQWLDRCRALHASLAEKRGETP